MSISVEQLQQRQSEFFSSVNQIKERLDQVDQVRNQHEEQRDALRHAYQQELSNRVAEGVFTLDFFESHGFKKERGRNSVKPSEDVQSLSSLDFNEVFEYMKTTFSQLNDLRNQTQESNEDQGLDEERKQLKTRYAILIYQAIDEGVVSRNQLISLGYKVPAKPRQVKQEEEATEESQEQ